MMHFDLFNLAIQTTCSKLEQPKLLWLRQGLNLTTYGCEACANDKKCVAERSGANMAIRRGLVASIRLSSWLG